MYSKGKIGYIKSPLFLKKSAKKALILTQSRLLVTLVKLVAVPQKNAIFQAKTILVHIDKPAKKTNARLVFFCVSTTKSLKSLPFYRVELQNDYHLLMITSTILYSISSPSPKEKKFPLTSTNCPICSSSIFSYHC